MADVEKKDVRTAHALGWTSIGIGLAELAAPRFLEHQLGVGDRPGQRGIFRALGVREVMHGVGILSQDRPGPQLTAAVGSRVIGDVLDTVLLAMAGRKTRRPGMFAAIAGTVAVIGLLDVLCTGWLMRRQRSGP